MAGLWSVIVPATDTNSNPNPSGETATTGYTATIGGTVSRSSEQAKFGSWSIKMVSSIGNFGGAYSPELSTTGTVYLSAWVYAATGNSVRVYYYKDGGVTLSSTITGNNKWQRVKITVTGIASAVKFWFRAESDAAATTWYVDGVQYSTVDSTYIDGDQPGCLWTGTAHASTSTRTNQERSGGVEYTFDSLGISVKSQTQPGTGMAPIVNNFTPSANLSGSQYNGYSVKQRDFALVLAVGGTTLADLHSKRQAFYNTIKPDLTGKAKPFWLYYTDVTASKRIGIKCVYQGGFDLGATGAFTEETEIRLVASDPFWYAEGNGSAAITTSLTVANADYIIRNVDGVWSAMAGLTGLVRAICITRDGVIYVGGDFTNASGEAAGDYIAKWEIGDTAWKPVGIGLNAEVYAIVEMTDGKIAVGGKFTNAGLKPNADYIATWNPATSAWNEIGTGMDNYVYALAVMPNGDLVAGGTFTTAGGTAVSRIAKWDGSAWSVLSTGIGGDVFCLTIDGRGILYAGGSFSSPSNNIAKWNGTAWSALSNTGLDDDVFAIAIGANNDVYVSGAFLYTGDSVISLTGSAKWNNSAWSALSPSYSGGSYAQALDYIGGILYAGFYNVSVYNGYSWSIMPAIMPGSVVVRSIKHKNNSMYVGYNSTGNAVTSYQNTVTVSNDREVNPIYKLVCSAGPGVLYSIRNDTTGRQMWFNYTIQTGETLTVNFDPLNFGAVSSFYGDVTGRALLRGSDFTQFKLLPGVNKISAFISGGTVEASLEWPLRFWAIDGITSL